MSASYLEWTKSQMLLLLLWNKLQEAYESGESELRVTVLRAGEESGIQLGYPVAVNVSDEIPKLRRGGEAVAVFERLRKEGYLSWETSAAEAPPLSRRPFCTVSAPKAWST